MDYIWIYTISWLFILGDVTNGQSEVRVQLVVKKYVERGASVSLQCKHNVPPEILHKVSWFKTGENKFFEYINGRDPPFRNFSLIGAEIDGLNSNELEVTLRRVDFQAAGQYFCEVSTDTPIFTKGSNEEHLHVILSQSGPPQITFRIRQTYYGEKLVANCTTTKAHPPPFITWMINGKKVDKKYTKPFHHRVSHNGKYDGGGGGYYNGGAAGNGVIGSGGHRIKIFQQNNNITSSTTTTDNKYEFSEKYNSKSSSSSSSIPHKGEPSHIQQKNIDYKNNIVTLMHYHFGNNKTSTNSEFDGDNDDFGRPMHGYHHGHNQHNRHTDNEEMIENINRHFNHKYRSSRKFRRNAIKKLKQALWRPLASKNQLNINVSHVVPDANGRIEITCIATIPPHADPGEDFADIKSTSAQVEIEIVRETTSLVPLRIDASALDSGNVNKNSNHLKNLCSKLNVSLSLIIIVLAIGKFMNM